MAKKYESSKEEVISVIDGVGIPRADLADQLNVSNRTLHQWIMDSAIPFHHYEKILELSNKKESVVTTKSTTLNQMPLDDLIAEIERRGFWVNIERKRDKA